MVVLELKGPELCFSNSKKKLKNSRNVGLCGPNKKYCKRFREYLSWPQMVNAGNVTFPIA